MTDVLVEVKKCQSRVLLLYARYWIITSNGDEAEFLRKVTTEPV